MPETLEKSLLSKISGIFFGVDLTGVEPIKLRIITSTFATL